MASTFIEEFTGSSNSESDLNEGVILAIWTAILILSSKESYGELRTFM